MNVKRYVRWGLNTLILIYIAVAGVVLAFGGFQFTFTVKSHTLIGPLLVILAAVTARVLLDIPPKNLAVAAVSVALTLVALEGFLRWSYPKKAWPVLRLYYRYAHEIGYEPVPDVAGTGSFGEAIVINSHGLRDVERPWAKPPGVTRILVLGDSFTFGMKVEAASSYPKALEAMLNGKGDGRRYDVINAGVVAYSLCQERKWLELKGWRYEPDLILIGFFADDPHCQGEESGLRFLEPRVYRTFTRVSALYNFLRNSYSVFKARYLEWWRPGWTGGLASRARSLERSRFTVVSEEEWAEATKDLKRIKAGAAKRGAALLVVVIPDAGQVGFPKHQSPTRRLLAICKAEGIACIDTTHRFESAPEPLDLYLYPLDPHLSPAGHALVARAIAERIAEGGMTGGTAPR
ncbi:GDSL-type esterase/lipase family protein [Nitrospinae bacterium AH_259_B05_G02_I21]|nr:GDSL-type esterase/lipase family protein [Nitrospinae bacterium AH_259_B05_G02_I21]